MKPIQRLGGMASLLLLVSLFSPVKANATELSNEVTSKSNIADRIAAVHDKLGDAEKELSISEKTSQEINDLVAQWYDWGDWGDWGDWVDWADWGDWGDWGDWVDWGDWYNY